ATLVTGDVVYGHDCGGGAYSQTPTSCDPLRINVVVASAHITPGHDRTPRAVIDNRGCVLVAWRGAEPRAVRRPLDRAHRRDALTIDVVVRPTAGVAPCGDRTVRTI